MESKAGGRQYCTQEGGRAGGSQDRTEAGPEGINARRKAGQEGDRAGKMHARKDVRHSR